MRILVVDDSVDAAETLAAILEIGGHETIVANSGKHALAAAEEFRPHAVFLDIGMPVMDGYQVARAMRAMAGMDKAVLVALTGWGSDGDREQAREAGFDRHLTKPAGMAEVTALLDAIDAAGKK